MSAVGAGCLVLETAWVCTERLGSSPGKKQSMFYDLLIRPFSEGSARSPLLGSQWTETSVPMQEVRQRNLASLAYVWLLLLHIILSVWHGCDLIWSLITHEYVLILVSIFSFFSLSTHLSSCVVTRVAVFPKSAYISTVLSVTRYNLFYNDFCSFILVVLL